MGRLGFILILVGVALSAFAVFGVPELLKHDVQVSLDALPAPILRVPPYDGFAPGGETCGDRQVCLWVKAFDLRDQKNIALRVRLFYSTSEGGSPLEISTVETTIGGPIEYVWSVPSSVSGDIYVWIAFDGNNNLRPAESSKLVISVPAV